MHDLWWFYALSDELKIAIATWLRARSCANRQGFGVEPCCLPDQVRFATDQAFTGKSAERGSQGSFWSDRRDFGPHKQRGLDSDIPVPRGEYSHVSTPTDCASLDVVIG